MSSDYLEKMSEIEMYPFVELFRITSRGLAYRYSNIESEIEFQGDEGSKQLYKIGLIKRSPFTIDNKYSSITTTLTANISEPLKKWVSNSPIDTTRVTIFRYFIDTTPEQYIVLFKGKVKKVSLSNQILTAQCETQTGIFRKKLPNIIYQGYCNNNIYDSICGVNENSFKVSLNCEVSGSKLINAGLSSYAKDWFTGGFVNYNSQIRLITFNENTEVTLQLPFSDVDDGDFIDVDLFAGCDKDPDTCKTKFSNFTNFVGFPYIPSKNPCIYGAR